MAALEGRMSHLICPHCGQHQQQQMIDNVGLEFAAIGIRTCDAWVTGDKKGCGEDFAIYARSILEIKTRKVVSE
jgi:hypothetical protein